MSRTYLYGYNGGRRTLADMETRPAWDRVHPEMRRRLVAMFDASQDMGREVGFGEGWRSAEAQRTVFLQRHTQVASGGCCAYDGKRWALKAGMAHAAPPGRSFHEESDAEGWCYAADLVGNLTWMNANADRFGLKHFANVNNEPWHVQPVEFPNARSAWNGQPPGHFPLPGEQPPPLPPPDPTEDPMQVRVISCSTARVPAQYVAMPDLTKRWINRDRHGGRGEMIAWLRAFGYDVIDGGDVDPTTMARLGPIIGPRPAGTDEYGF